MRLCWTRLHSEQSLALSLPGDEEWPDGHCDGSSVPAGQLNPAGQTVAQNEELWCCGARESPTKPAEQRGGNRSFTLSTDSRDMKTPVYCS